MSKAFVNIGLSLVAYASVSDTRATIVTYLSWCNKDRAHSGIDQTPDESYPGLLPNKFKKAG